MHLHFVGKFVPFLQIAGDAGGDDIRPFGNSAPGPGDEMITGEMFRVELLSAILTGMIVPKKDIFAGEFHPGVIAPDEGEKAYDGRLPYGNGNTVDFPVIFLEDFNFSEINERDRLLPRQDADGFKGCVKQEGPVHLII
jgi:hypothetical protein